MELKFEGKRALVTGVGRGIGRAIAIALSKGGATVHGLSRTKKDLDSLQKEVPDIHVHTVDISDWDQTRQVVQKIGPVDLLVNNAGIQLVKSFFDTTKQDVYNSFDINTHAVFNISQVVAQGMVDRGQGGSIVNLSTIGSIKPFPMVSAYSMSKAALNMLTKSMALELGQHKVRVNSVHPTAVNTDMFKNYAKQTKDEATSSDDILARTPCGSYAEVEDVVNAVLFLLSDKAAMVTGSQLPVDGGLLIG